MYLVVGLGNPGKKYEYTRHNMGFIAIDVIADKFNIKVDKLKFKALVGEGNIAGQKVILMKPQTYMNLSGEAVRDAVNFYKIPMENLIVIYDDIDIELGTIRVRKFGSAGTHNGMRNIIYLLSDDKFPRIRVGSGGKIKDSFKGDLADFVIGNITKEEEEPLRKAIIKATEAAESIIAEGIDMAMNKYNKKDD